MGAAAGTVLTGVGAELVGAGEAGEVGERGKSEKIGALLARAWAAMEWARVAVAARESPRAKVLTQRNRFINVNEFSVNYRKSKGLRPALFSRKCWQIGWGRICFNGCR